MDIKKLSDIKREYISQVLQKTNGDWEKAGEILGLSIGQLKSIMEKSPREENKKEKKSRK